MAHVEGTSPVSLESGDVIQSVNGGHVQERASMGDPSASPLLLRTQPRRKRVTMEQASAATRRMYNSRTYMVIYILLACLNLALLIFDAVNYTADSEGAMPPLWFIILDFVLTGALIAEIIIRLISGSNSRSIKKTLKDWILWADIVVALLSLMSSIATALQNSPVLISLGSAVLIFRYVGHSLRLFTFVRNRRKMARLNSTANLFRVDFDRVGEETIDDGGSVYNGEGVRGRGISVVSIPQQHTRRDSVETVSTVASDEYDEPGRAFVIP
mmetsp:Transcript_40607/g.105416  ORF Transcript_40607/g.105416 Transcript_40607/m.105416 type:complete len:271 (-) Transcript_40607:167-979(-)